MNLLLFVLPVALAEGTAELGTAQALRAGTVLGVDILDASVETITWTGTGSVSVTDPGGSSLGTFASGDTITPTEGLEGAYVLEVGSDQSRTAGWDVTVEDAVDDGGRLHSTDWAFDAGSFASSAATSASFYARVPAGGGTAVIELKLDGLAGYVFDINANRTGVDGDYAGRSVAQSATSVTPEFDIFLNPPSDADYSSASPVLSDLDFEGAQVSEDVSGAALSCDAVEIGGSGATFAFNSDAEGTWQLQCDLDGDGDFAMVDGTDLFLVGEAAAGDNDIAWDGTNADGTGLDEGIYDCRVRLTVGEFHYVGADIETSYPGMRLFEVDASGGRTGLTMYWDDSEVQANAQAMTDGSKGLERSGEAGVSSGAYTDAASPNTNARSWGAWNSGGKGNRAFLDTFTWLASDASATLEVQALLPTTDSDGDGLSDVEELCTYGTDPEVTDSDGDGVDDGDQHGPTESSTAETSGLESNGRMSHALARRLVRQRSGVPNLPPPPSGLASFVPAQGPAGSTPSAATPDDLSVVTNALAAYGVDYRGASGERVASVLLVETRGEAYEHTKPTCDRAAGSRLLGVHAADFGDGKGFGASLRTADGAVRDEATTITFVAQDDGGWHAWPTWLPEDAGIGGDRSVIQAQVWAARRDHRDTLARSVVERFSPTWQDVATPQAWVGAVSLAGGRWSASIVNPENLPLSVVADARWEDGSRSQFAVDAPEALLQVDGEPLRELTLSLVSSGKTLDRVWVSDGAWVELSDADLGGTTAIHAFSDAGCGAEDRSLGAEGLGVSLEPGATALAGCGSVSASVSDWVGVGRTLQPAMDLAGTPRLLAWVEASSAAALCVESAVLGSFRCADVSPAPAGRWVLVDFAEEGLSGAGADPLAAASLITLRTSGPGEVGLGLGGLAFTAGHAAPLEEPLTAGASGCQAAPVGTVLWPVLLLLVCRRR